MIRRRRPVREIAFSFDSFLDVVANVVGIIIRLILVAWVGARSYGTLHVVPGAAQPAAEASAQTQRPSEEIRSIEKLPPLTKTLHYRTPVSRPVQADELLFECQHGRVAFIDIAALLVEVRRGLEDKGQMLRSRWQISDTVGPVGPF